MRMHFCVPNYQNRTEFLLIYGSIFLVPRNKKSTIQKLPGKKLENNTLGALVLVGSMKFSKNESAGNCGRIFVEALYTRSN